MSQQQDLVQAKLNADEPSEDEALRKKLWLRIARHVVEEKNDIRTYVIGADAPLARFHARLTGPCLRMCSFLWLLTDSAMAFLRECELLKIEDVLPFFPDFVLIDDFKDEISAALTEYNEHIEDLKHEMDSATQSAEAIRRDIRDLRNKYVSRTTLRFCTHARGAPDWVASSTCMWRQIRVHRGDRQVPSLQLSAAHTAVLPLPVPALLPRRLPHHRGQPPQAVNPLVPAAYAADTPVEATGGGLFVLAGQCQVLNNMTSSQRARVADLQQKLNNEVRQPFVPDVSWRTRC